MASPHRIHHTAPTTLLTLAACLAAQPPVKTLASTPNTYIGPDGGLWSNPANWSTGHIPSDQSFDASIIQNSNSNVLLDIDVEINSLAISSPNALTIQGNKLLTIDGGQISNSGTIVLNDFSCIAMKNATTLSGNGTILLSSSTSSIIDRWENNTPFIIAGKIIGQGTVGLGNIATNSGTITASNGVMALGFFGLTNQGMLRADGGDLGFTFGINIENNGGIIEATNNFNFSASYAQGGTILLSNHGSANLIKLSDAVIDSPDATGSISLSSLYNCTNNASLILRTTTFLSGDVCEIGGSINNAGTITISPGSDLSFRPDTEFRGTGTLVLSGGRFGGNPIFSSSHITNYSTIVGFGSIGWATFGNDFQTRFENHGTVRASGGKLVIRAGFDNLAGAIDVEEGATLTLVTQIIGGTISVAGASSIDLSNTPAGSMSSVTITGNPNIIGPTFPLGSSAPLSQVNFLGRPSFAGTILIAGSASSLTHFSCFGALTFDPSFSSLPAGGSVSLTGTLTGQSLVNSSDIRGSGLISFSSLTNNGPITAQDGTLTISGFADNTGGTIQAFSNSSLVIKSTLSGGTLRIFPASTLTLSGPTSNIDLQLDPGSTVVLNSTLSGFTLTTNTILQSASLINITNNATMATQQSSFAPNVFMAGTITNNGLFQSGFGSSSLSARTLTIADGTLLTGAGTLLLSNYSSNVLTGSTSVHFASSSTIMGAGQIKGILQFINTGTLIASSSSAGFIITVPSTPQSLVNTGTLRADGGGTVTINGACDNTGGLIEAINGSTVLINGNLTGGRLNIGPTSNITVPLGKLSSLFPVTNGVLSVSSDTFSGNLTFPAEIRALPFCTLTLSGPTSFTGGGTLTTTGSLSIMASSQATSSSLTGTNPLFVRGGTLTVDIHFLKGGFAFTQPITLDNGQFNMFLGQLSQSIASISGSGTVTLSQAGGGPNAILTSDGILVTSLRVSNTLRIRANDGPLGTSKLSSLFIATNPSSAFTATFDLTDNKFILQSTGAADKSTKISQLTSALISGSNAGTWTGKGITSSTAGADPQHYAIGLFDNSILTLPSFGGQPVDANSLLLTIAHLGDANDGGVVDIQDQSVITNNWQKPGSTWSNGDLNLDGFVDIQDLTLVTNNWQQESAFSLDSGFKSQDSGPAPIPEPLSLPILAFPFLSLIRHRAHARTQNRPSPAKKSPPNCLII
jgi:hypothetical protein